MTTLATLISDVYSLTNRDDLVAETALAVRAATLKMHQSDFYPRDIYETGIDFGASDYTQQLDYKGLIPTWRSLKYLRKYDYTTSPGSAGIGFRVITPDQIFDSYHIEVKDVMYLAGSYFNIKSSTSFQYALLGCYVLPVVTDAAYSSWIADDHPYAIECEAARVIFKMIGYDEQSAAYERLVAEQVAELKMSQILANGS